MSEGKAIKENLANSVFEVITPFARGLGIYLLSHNLVVARQRLVGDRREVVLTGKVIDRQVVQVLFSDEKYDLSILSPPVEKINAGFSCERITSDPTDEKVFYIALNREGRLDTASGKVLSVSGDEMDTRFVKHDARNEELHHRGMVVDTGNRIIGINSTFSEEGTGVVIWHDHIVEMLDTLVENPGSTGVRCPSCESIVMEFHMRKDMCVNCGSTVLLPSSFEPYKPEGVPGMIEDIIMQLGHDVRLSREGYHHWTVQRGSALIRLSYHSDSGLIDGDAYLCRLPDDPLKKKEINLFLMRENYLTEGLVLSLKEGHILLSLMIYDRHLERKTGRALISKLFEKADHYDDILVEKFGGIWV